MIDDVLEGGWGGGGAGGAGGGVLNSIISKNLIHYSLKC